MWSLYTDNMEIYQEDWLRSEYREKMKKHNYLLGLSV